MWSVNLKENECWLCRVCKCNNNCCYFNIFKKKRKFHEISLKSQDNICLCEQHNSEYERIKFLVDLLIKEHNHNSHESYDSREC